MTSLTNMKFDFFKQVGHRSVVWCEETNRKCILLVKDKHELEEY